MDEREREIFLRILEMVESDECPYLSEDEWVDIPDYKQIPDKVHHHIEEDDCEFCSSMVNLIKEQSTPEYKRRMKIFSKRIRRWFIRCE